MAATPTLTVRLPQRVRSRLARRARAQRLTLGAYVRKILWDHVTMNLSEVSP